MDKTLEGFLEKRPKSSTSFIFTINCTFNNCHRTEQTKSKSLTADQTMRLGPAEEGTSVQYTTRKRSLVCFQVVSPKSPLLGHPHILWHGPLKLIHINPTHIKKIWIILIILVYLNVPSTPNSQSTYTIRRTPNLRRDLN